MLPLTSIIIVTFHTGDALFATIAGVLRQSAPLELILVDNGNPDDIVGRLRAAAAADDRVQLITGGGNVGFARANNIGVTASRGEHILILNPDCLLRDDVLQKLLRYAASLPPLFMIGARILNPDGSDQRGCRRALLTPLTALVEALHLGRLLPRWRLNRQDEQIPDAIAAIPAISGAFMFLPRRAFDSINGFDEGYFLHVEDLDFCFRFRRAGGEIYFAPDIIATHIGGTSLATSDFIERHKMWGFIRYFHQNFGSIRFLPLLWCLDLAIGVRYLVRRFLTITQHLRKNND